REIGAGTSSSEIAQRQHEQRQARAVAHHADKGGERDGNRGRHASAHRQCQRHVERTGDQPLELNDLQWIGERDLAGEIVVEPQATQAPTMARGPSRPESVGCPDHERTSAPNTRQAMPSAMRRSKFSWKTNHAMSAVATPSRVSINDAALA